jgi:GT2 family glycosyltransferase
LIRLEKNSGAARARNVGIGQATGDYIAFTDSDCVVEPDWLTRLIRNFEDPRIAGVSGVYRTWNKHSSLARFIGHDMALRHQGLPDTISLVGTFNCAFTKAVLDVDRFDETQKGIFWEDVELGYRISRKHTIRMDRDTFVYHNHPSTLSGYFKRQRIRAAGQMILRKSGGETDNYMGWTSVMQIPVTGLLYASMILGLIRPPWLLATLGLAGVMVGLNAGLLIYMAREERPSFMIRSTLYILVRNTAWIFGAFQGLFSRRRQPPADDSSPPSKIVEVLGL